MTEVNGLRLAYRGLVAGLCGGYIWLAVAIFAAIPGGDAVAALRHVVAATPETSIASPAERFVVLLGLVQLAAGGIGMAFAYFLARYFTIRRTLAAAGPCFAILAWAVLGDRVAGAVGVGSLEVSASAALLAATLAYGLVLGTAVPIRGEVLRYSGSPST